MPTTAPCVNTRVPRGAEAKRKMRCNIVAASATSIIVVIAPFGTAGGPGRSSFDAAFADDVLEISLETESVARHVLATRRLQLTWRAQLMFRTIKKERIQSILDYIAVGDVESARNMCVGGERSSVGKQSVRCTPTHSSSAPA